MFKRIDIKGKKFNRLTVVEFAFKKKGVIFWKCKCDCGEERNIRSQDIRIGHAKSCGCIQNHKSLKDAFKSRTFLRNGDCTEWIGALTGSGYGVIKFRSKNYLTHRIAYQIEYGKIPNGKLIRHLCHNSRCCNPKHLEVGNTQDNSNDCVAAGRQNKGAEVNTAKLKKYQVLQIRASTIKKEKSITQLAEEYGVSKTHIGRIINRKSWSHI